MAATQPQNPRTAPMPAHQGHAPAGHAPTGHTPAGHAPAGHAPAGHAPSGHTPARHALADQRPGLATTLRPLAIDVGIPLATYYLLRDAFGVSLWLSLALSSIGPAVRSIAGLVAERKLNVLA